MSGAKKKQEAARQARLAREAAERAAQERAKRLKLLGGVGVAIVAIVAIVLALGLFREDATENLSEQTVEVNGEKVGIKGGEATAALYSGIPQNGDTLGDPNAPATIIEIADLKCPACQLHAIETHPEVVKQLVRTGKANLQIKLVNFRDPAAGTTDGADARVAAYNLLPKNTFFNFVNVLFANQGSEAETWATERKLKAIAEATPGVGADALNIKSNAETDKLVEKDDKLAEALQIQGTPSVFVKPRGSNEYTQVANFNDIGEISSLVEEASKKATSSKKAES